MKQEHIGDEPHIHILQPAVQPQGEKEGMAELRKKMPRCPICGKKAYLDHSIVDGFDFGYDAGCPHYCIKDGVHGIEDSYDPKAPHVTGYSAKQAFDAWLKYCKRMGEAE